MTDAPNPPTQDEEPAEGSRETVEEALEQQASAEDQRSDREPSADPDDG